MKVLIGVGNEWRGDDAAGREVAARLRGTLPATVRVTEETGEPASLIEAWSGADEAIVVDCVCSGGRPGARHRFEAHERPLPAQLFAASTHGLGVAEAVELARELGRLPARLVVYGVAGESFEAGDSMTPAVETAVGELVAELRRDYERGIPTRPGPPAPRPAG